MLYRVNLAIPAGTSRYSPVDTYLNVTEGIITKWLIGFPPGCAGLVHLAVYWHEQKIMPEGEAESLYWSDYMFDPEEEITLNQPPYRLRVYGWNEDVVYRHTVFVGAVLMPIPEETELGLLQKLARGLIGG